MIKVVLDAAMRGKLDRLTQPAELCDESGRVLGRFLPAPDLTRCEPLGPQVSGEELQQRRSRSDEKSYTTSEVLAHLEML